MVQLYIQFPSDAGEPRLVLGAFTKTKVLRPSETATVALTLHERDFSVWAGEWKVARGLFVFHVGTSSRDPRLTHQTTLVP